MKRVAFYCQHLLGVGHLTRSLNICSELMKEFKVDFIQGGVDIGRTLSHRNFKHHFLSPLTMDEVSGNLIPSQHKNIEATWVQRESQLQNVCTSNFDAIVIELFPFGRKAFASEVISFLNFLKKNNPQIKVICSLRDILVEKKNWDARQDKIIKTIHESFDYVLVHSDAKYIPLDKTFPKAEEIMQQMIYTGFIAEPFGKLTSPRKNQVLVSIGGGIVGEELVRATVEAAKLVSEVNFIFVKSPNMSPEINRTLDSISQSNVTVIEFSNRYQQLLCESKLSVSLAGYNTMMNLLQTKTFGLVFPYQKSTEQILRAKLLAEHSLVYSLNESEVNAVAISQLIQRKINHSDWNHLNINLSGAVQSAEWLKQLLSR